MKRTRNAAALVVALLLATAYAVTAALQWIPVGRAPVSGGYGEAVVGDGSSVFVARCLFATSQPQFYRYSPSEDAWQEESTSGLELGTFRTGTALAADSSGTIYALVGARYADADRRGFLAYDTVSRTWARLADTPYSQGAGDALTWCGLDKRVYALAGSSRHNGGASYFLAYDPNTKGWEELPTPWVSTDDGAALAWTGDEYIYALRGEFAETVPNGSFARYSIRTRRWAMMPDMPVKGGVGDGGSLLYVGRWDSMHANQLYALTGGSAAEEPGFGFFIFDLVSQEWTTGTPLPCPVGYYVGNRLGYAQGRIFCWQGSPQPEQWVCGGDSFFSASLDTDPAAAKEDPCARCLARLNSASRAGFDSIEGIGEVKSAALAMLGSTIVFRRETGASPAQ